MLIIGANDYVKLCNEEIKMYTKYAGYQKLKQLTRDNYNDKQQFEILSQYCLLLKYFDTDNNNIILKYVTENFPEIISFIDLIDSKLPYYKFVWSFKKKDEEKIDEIFSYESLEFKKYNINFNNNDILIYIVNSIVNGDYNIDITRTENGRRVETLGFKPLYQFKKRMIEHGMSWYVFGNPETNFFSSCIFHNKSILHMDQEDDTWSKIGYREDLDCIFKSSWEANIARILNSKEISWAYEKKMFELSPPKYYNNSLEKLYYLPDFILKDGTIIEIKGFWDNRSILKVSQFIQQYPKEKYIVIDKDIYRNITKKYKNIIPYWEDDNISNSTDVIQVVGITIPQRKNAVTKVRIGDELKAIREPNNEYDSMAIRVNDLSENQIGYFAKDCNSIYAPKMDMGFKYRIVVSDKQPKVIQCKIKLNNENELILPDLFR